ncbi:MAG: hypothetical protein ACJ79H_17080 [Myxococcales bacterium]
MHEQSANGGGEKHETSGHAGASSEAELQKEGLAPGERESIAAEEKTHVKSLARGMMEKGPEQSAGPITEVQKLDEMAKAAPKVQARFQKKKASRVTRGKTGKPDFARKSVRGGKNKASKAGKVGFRGKAGRKAAAQGAKKGTRGGRSKQKGRPVGKGDRRSALGRGPGSSGQGRTSAKGGRGKTGARQRPSPRRSYR